LCDEDQTSNLQIIGYDAFSNCRLLAKLELPLSVKEIRDDALHNYLKSLVQVKLPHGLKWMGERTFAWLNKKRNMQLALLARHTSRMIENKMIENKRDDDSTERLHNPRNTCNFAQVI